MKCVSVVIPCYRDGDRALAAARLGAQLELPPGWECEIVVVDDGSNDASAQRLVAGAAPPVRVVVLDENVGRSAARNRGATEAVGEMLVFLDSDCIPDGDFLACHVRALESGAVASTGPVHGIEGNFW